MSGAGSIEWRGTSARLTYWIAGKRHHETIPPGPNGERPKATDVKRRLRELLSLADRHQHPNDPERLLANDWWPRWLRQHRQLNDIKPRSAHQYETTIKTHFDPAFVAIRLSKLERAHILDFLAGLADKGLAPNTRRQIKTTLVMALDAAVDARLIAVNPAAGIRTKRPRAEKRTTLNQEQCRALLEETRGKRLYMPALLAIAGGLRRGEICALKWAAVDLDRGMIDVRENMVTVKGETIICLPKSGEARTVTMPANVCADLRAAKRRQAEELLRLGVRQTPETLVLDGIEGPMTPTALTLAFGRLMRRLRLPVTRFHDLRHAHATRLLTLGVPIGVVAERLGHHDGGALLLRTYNHSSQQDHREAADNQVAALVGDLF
jgi:integrase